MPNVTGEIEDPVRAERERRFRQKQNAVKQLEALEQKPGKLQRPVFFVPGWRDEGNVCWMKPYSKGYTALAEWLPRVVKNPELAEYITFTEEESKSCPSFLDFGEILKGKIWDSVGKQKDFDVVGHSMAGLDTIAAITSPNQPLRRARRLVTVGTPHQGSELGEFGTQFIKAPKHIILQGVNLDPDQLPIQMINHMEVRQELLENVEHLYCLMGTRDMAVMGSGRFNKEGLSPKLYAEKVTTVEIEGARHSSALGITQDVRTILCVATVLLDLELDKPQQNYGYIYKSA